MKYVQNQELSAFLGSHKYFQAGETKLDAINRIVATLADNEEHHQALKDIMLHDRFLFGGRIMAGVGSARRVTAFNCYVSRTIEDSMEGIGKSQLEALQTMRMGGGIGYDFSTIRPNKDLITSLDSLSSGPVGDENTHGIMDWYDAGCAWIRSAGHRRGAQMAVLRVDHPDIQYFVRSKKTPNRLRNFNISVGITDEFMEAVVNGEKQFPLKFNGKVYRWIDPCALWDEIMRTTWDYAEPGVIFLDTINRKNNLSYCETISTTNPCGEQPLPPFGACLLGSFNLPAYIERQTLGSLTFNLDQFKEDIPHIVRAMDNVIDNTFYPLVQQEQEALNKRRMGIGVTGLSTAADAKGYSYGSSLMLQWSEFIFKTLRDDVYTASINLAKEKGVFPLYDHDEYQSDSTFVASLPEEIRSELFQHGIRNSHLLSIAPTGTISLFAGNVSSGIEPAISLKERFITAPDGSFRTFHLEDYGFLKWGIEPTTSDDLTMEDHLAVFLLASKYVDSAVSKTCNVGPEVSFSEFKDVYIKAWMGGASGCTTYRHNPDSGRGSVFVTTPSPEESGASCTFDEHGQRTCGSD